MGHYGLAFAAYWQIFLNRLWYIMPLKLLSGKKNKQNLHLLLKTWGKVDK
jgi:hypothetical protein